MSSFTLVTGGYDTSIRFFDATNQSLIRTIQFCDQQVLRLAFSSDAPVSHDAPLFLIAGGSPTVGVYDVTHVETSPTLFQMYQGHTEAVTAVGFEPKHTAFAYSSSEDGTLQTWIPQLSTHAHVHFNTTNSNNNNNPHGVTHPMAAGIYFPPNTHQLRFKNSVPCTIRNLNDTATAAAIAANNRRPKPPLSSNRPKQKEKDKDQNSTHPSQPQPPPLPQTSHSINCVPIHDAVYYHPRNLFFTVDAAGRFRIWNHVKGVVTHPLLSLVPHPSRRNIQCIELSTDQTTVVMANFDGYVFVYDVEHLLTAISLRTSSSSSSSSSSTSSSSSSSSTSTSSSLPATGGTTATNTIPIPIPSPSPLSFQPTLSATATATATANASTSSPPTAVAQVGYSPATPMPIVFRAYHRYIPRVRLSVSGALLVCTTASGVIKLYRMADIVAHAHCQHQPFDPDHIPTITPLREFTGQRSWIWDAAFVEDRDDYLFTCSSNMQVMLWSLSDLQNSSEYLGHNKGVVCLAVRERMSPDVAPEHFGPQTYDYIETVSPPDEEPHPPPGATQPV